MHRFKIEVKIVLDFSSSNIDDLVVTALEGGINDWCDKAVVSKEPEEEYEYASDVISKGGELTLYEPDSEQHVLTLEKLLKGIKRYCEECNYINAEALMDNYDVYAVDTIIQYAIFDELVYS